VNLYQVDIRDEDQTGEFGSFTSIVRAENAKDAALFVVNSEVATVMPDLDSDEDLQGYLSLADDISVVEIPAADDGQEGYVRETWQDFSLEALLKELEPQLA
jgi:hypothetical protein